MRLILTLLLLTLTAPAWAEWVKYTEDAIASYYYDTATIEKRGNLRRVWELSDLKEAFEGALSIRGMAEYDCKEERGRGLSFISHTEQMARGKILVSRNEADKWSYIRPNTVSALMLEIVCQ
jgi:hypothetical protein